MASRQMASWHMDRHGRSWLRLFTEETPLTACLSRRMLPTAFFIEEEAFDVRPSPTPLRSRVLARSRAAGIRGERRETGHGSGRRAFVSVTVTVLTGMLGACTYETVSSFRTEADIRKSEYRLERVSSHQLNDVTTCMDRALRGHTTDANEHPHAAIQVEQSEFIDTIALRIPGPLIDGRYRQEGTLLYLIENRANFTTGTTYRFWVNPLIEAPGPQSVLTEVDALVKPCL